MSRRSRCGGQSPACGGSKDGYRQGFEPELSETNVRDELEDLVPDAELSLPAFNVATGGYDPRSLKFTMVEFKTMRASKLPLTGGRTVGGVPLRYGQPRLLRRNRRHMLPDPSRMHEPALRAGHQPP
eukprot:jgi/Tetstr1/444298/TSEL_032189.t1